MATRMQQRRGTATQWTNANPVLAAGEIGFETDTGQFKMGDGVTAWSGLAYFKDMTDLGGSLDDYILLTQKGAANGVATLNADAQIPIEQLATIIQNAPTTLDTLSEIASAIGDANGIVDTAIDTAIAAEVTARNTAITTAIDTEVGNRNTAINLSRTEIAGDIQTAITSRIAAATTSDINEGINQYFTVERAQDAAASMVTGASGVLATYDDAANTLTISLDATVATTTTVSTAVSDHNSDTTNVHGIVDTAALATKTYADNAVSTHEADTTNVHGIADTAALATKTYADGKASDAETAAATSAAALYATKVAPAITGNATVENITVTGNLTVNGTTTSVSSTNLEVTDPLVYIGTGNLANSKDLGVVGHFDNGTYQHTGIVRDATDGKWKLFSGVTTEPTDVIDFTSPTYDILRLGAVEFADGTQSKQGVPSITTISQKTASYTLAALTERDTLIEVGSSSATTLTIPADSTLDFPVGTTLDILQTSTGQVTIAGAVGVTVNATPGLKLRTQWSSATLMKRAANTWVVYGDLSA
jgi:hypothetical protein